MVRNRRDVLRMGAGAAVVTVATGPASTWARGQAVAAAPRGATDEDWLGLSRSLPDGGTVYRPDDAAYWALSIPSNHRYAGARPAGIVCCSGPSDVAAAIRWAREHGVAVAPRSGGHNYAGHSTTTGLVIDVSRMKDVRVDTQAGTITVGAGVTNGDLHPHLKRHNVLMPSGRCPTVGVAGLVLGGGIGFSDRKLGLTCDALRSTDVVTAASDVVTADLNNDHSDLFWACRGGAGGNFGINTSFTFRIEPAADVILYDLTWDLAQAPAVLREMQRIVADRNTPDGFDLRIGVGTSGHNPAEAAANANVGIIGQHFGTRTELDQLLDPVLKLPQRRTMLIEKRTAFGAAEYLFRTTPVAQYHVKSSIVKVALDQAAVGVIMSAVRSWPGSRNEDGAGVAMFAMGGAVNRMPAGATAFVHRDSLFVLAMDTSWLDSDPPEVASANLAWLRDLYDKLGPHLSGSAYQNFADADLANWRTAYYGANYARLQTVKRTYDPGFFFRHAQGVGT